jgi:hypothetical protein
MGLCGQPYARVHFIPQLGTLDWASRTVTHTASINYKLQGRSVAIVNFSLKFFIPKLGSTKKRKNRTTISSASGKNYLHKSRAVSHRIEVCYFSPVPYIYLYKLHLSAVNCSRSQGKYRGRVFFHILWWGVGSQSKYRRVDGSSHAVTLLFFWKRRCGL